jgi:Cell wall-active antibiotics response LiaF, C-terminal/N-terminal domain of toast_rack, DUF2154
MKQKPFIQLLLPILFGLALIFSAARFIAPVSEKYRHDIKQSGERELKVTLDAAFGTIRIERGISTYIMKADVETDLKRDISESIDYEKRDDLGYLSINTTEGTKKERHRRNISLGEFEKNDWFMQFTDKLPISFDIELDFTGLSVKDLNLSTGASSVVLRFDDPNKETIENITIETGLSKFKGYGLCNANFDHMSFEGGLGSYVLDFSGKLNKEVDVNIKVGFGTMTIWIPEDIGAKITHEKSFLSSIDVPKDFTEDEDNIYFSKNYEAVQGKINMYIEAGLGSIKIKRQ